MVGEAPTGGLGSLTDDAKPRAMPSNAPPRTAIFDVMVPARLAPTMSEKNRRLTTTAPLRPARGRPPCTWVGDVGKPVSYARRVGKGRQEAASRGRRPARRPPRRPLSDQRDEDVRARHTA